jgi:hypothetical protein
MTDSTPPPTGTTTDVAPRRKPWWLVAALAAGVLCAAAVWLSRSPQHPITAATYDHLSHGMTRAEVESFLGAPGRTRDDFSRWMNNRSPFAVDGPDLLNERRHLSGIEYWYQDSGVIVLRFDADGRVAEKQFLGLRVSTVGQHVNRLRERIGW